MWDANTGKLIKTLEGHTTQVNSASYSHDGTQIITCSEDTTCKIWDAAKGIELQTLQGHLFAVKKAIFSPDDKYMVSCSTDTTIKIWNRSLLDSGLQVLKGHHAGIPVFRISPDEKYIATPSWDKTVKLWDSTSGIELHTLRGHPTGVFNAYFSENSKYLLSHCTNTWILWECTSGKELFVAKNRMKISPNNEVFSSYEDSVMIIRSLKSREPLEPIIDHGSKIFHHDFSLNGQYLAIGLQNNKIQIYRFLESTRFEHLRILEGHTQFASHFIFSPNSQLLASCSFDTSTKIWEVETGNLISTLIDDEYPKAVTGVEFSPTGDHIITRSYDDPINLSDSNKEKKDNTLLVWDPFAGIRKIIILNHFAEYLQFAFNNNGTLLATWCEKESFLNVWNPYSGDLVNVIRGHSADIFHAAFSRDGNYLVTSSYDFTSKIWDPISGKLYKTLEGHTSRITHVKFYHDSLICTSSDDQTCKIWSGIPSTENLPLYYSQGIGHKKMPKHKKLFEKAAKLDEKYQKEKKNNEIIMDKKRIDEDDINHYDQSELIDLELKFRGFKRKDLNSIPVSKSISFMFDLSRFEAPINVIGCEVQDCKISANVKSLLKNLGAKIYERKYKKLEFIPLE